MTERVAGSTQTDCFLDSDEWGVLAAAGAVSARDAESTVGGRYADFDCRSRTDEAALGDGDEQDDLRAGTSAQRIAFEEGESNDASEPE